MKVQKQFVERSRSFNSEGLSPGASSDKCVGRSMKQNRKRPPPAKCETSLLVFHVSLDFIEQL